MTLVSPEKPRARPYEDDTIDVADDQADDQTDGTPREIPDRTFAELGIPADLIDVLEEAGITDPFPVQTLTIPDALEGRDVTGKAQTGSGKTLAFGLPMIERTTTAHPRRPHALVLVPTRELANQVAEELTPLAAARGLWLSAIYGGVSMSRQIEALREGVDIVIATPGRLNDLVERKEISLREVGFVVIDEADHMADMGFLPQVARVLGQTRGEPQTLLFSATLDGMVATLIERYQHEPGPPRSGDEGLHGGDARAALHPRDGVRQDPGRGEGVRRRAARARLRAHDARRRPARQATGARGPERRPDPRPSRAEQARAHVAALRQRLRAGARRHQHRGARPAHR